MNRGSEPKAVDQENRSEAFSSLPPHIRESLTQEEKDAFLHSEIWPESLFAKLEEFMISDD